MVSVSLSYRGFYSENLQTTICPKKAARIPLTSKLVGILIFRIKTGMRMIKRNIQKSGDSSVNLQAENITVNTGLSIAHVKEIALDVFEDNFHKLAGVAKESADQRAKEITDQVLKELSEKNPFGLKTFQDPDFQYSLFQAQKEYARSGDKELGDILVDILVDRSKEEERTLLQLVLNESLLIAPKLNSAQLDLLACCFSINYTKKTNIANLQMFTDFLDDFIFVFADAVGVKDSNYKHIEYVGCGVIRAGAIDIVDILMSTYKAIFCKGFHRDQLEEISRETPNIHNVLTVCGNNTRFLQAKGMDDEVTRALCKQQSISVESTNKLLQLNNSRMMNKDEATDFLKSICPKFDDFLKNAANSSFNYLDLTSVGIAIAHAHSRKKTGLDAELSIWI